MQPDVLRPSIHPRPRPAYVRKRDGRLEELNDEKLIASIHQALEGARTSELWRVNLVASVVLQGLRTLHGPLGPLPTAEIAAATSLVMDIASFSEGGRAYGAFGVFDRGRRASHGEATDGVSTCELVIAAPRS